MAIKAVHGVDASWTGLAIVTLFEDDNFEERIEHKLLTSKKIEGQDPAERLDGLGRQFAAYFQQYDSQAIFMEGYSMGSMNNREMMGELGGHLKWLLWKAGLKTVLVSPNTLKKWVCGTGKGKKDAMMMHAFKRWKFEAPNDDVCDAFGLAKLAQASLSPDKFALEILRACPGSAHYVAKKKVRKKKDEA